MRGSQMVRLFLVIYTLASTALAGMGIIAALTMGKVDVTSIMIAAVVGAVVAVPVAWGVARKLQRL